MATSPHRKAIKKRQHIMPRQKTKSISLIDTFSEFKETKNIDRTTLISVLEESFRSVIAKLFGSDENFDIIVNP